MTPNRPMGIAITLVVFFVAYFFIHLTAPESWGVFEELTTSMLVVIMMIVGAELGGRD